MMYLIGPNPPRARQFYHKDPQTWTVPFEETPGRPIVSDCGSESYNSAQCIDHFLNPLSQLHNSYLKDTYDFIDKIKSQSFPQHSFLFTIDIESLYTNINTEQGLQAVADLFRRHPDPRPDNERDLEINLTHNDFNFNSEHFYRFVTRQWARSLRPLTRTSTSTWPIGNTHSSKN